MKPSKKILKASAREVERQREQKRHDLACTLIARRSVCVRNMSGSKVLHAETFKYDAGGSILDYGLHLSPDVTIDIAVDQIQGANEWWMQALGWTSTSGRAIAVGWGHMKGKAPWFRPKLGLYIGDAKVLPTLTDTKGITLYRKGQDDFIDVAIFDA